MTCRLPVCEFHVCSLRATKFVQACQFFAQTWHSILSQTLLIDDIANHIVVVADVVAAVVVDVPVLLL